MPVKDPTTNEVCEMRDASYGAWQTLRSLGTAYRQFCSQYSYFALEMRFALLIFCSEIVSLVLLEAGKKAGLCAGFRITRVHIT